MKKGKKLFTLFMAVVMMFAMSITAYATSSGTGDGTGSGDSTTYTITIKNAAKGETYTAYKLFDVSYSTDKKSYTYYIPAAESSGSYTEPALVTALKANDIGLTFTVSADESMYIVNQTTTGSGDTTEVVFKGSTDGTTITAAQLAEKINTKMKDTNTNDLKTALGSGTQGTTTTSGTGDSETTTATINVTTAGYYFVDSSLGALCSLDTASPTVEMYEKNSTPTIKKEVKEGTDTATTYADSATVDIIDTISYKLTVNTGNTGNSDTNDTKNPTGVDADYVIKDTLPAGVKVDTTNIAITTNTGTSGAAETWTAKGSTDTSDDGKDYKVEYTEADTGDTLTITLLSTGKLKSLAKNTDITITYTATVDDKTKIKLGYDTTDTTKQNPNKATLTYQKQTSEDTATFYTFEIGGDNFTKKANSNDGSAMADVEFILSKSDGSATKYATIDNNGYLTSWSDTKASATAIKTDNNGHISVKGLDAGDYTLTETKTNEGYNLLEDTITVSISEQGAVTYKLTKGTGTASDTITVINTTGSELPSTGGMGTSLLYIIGAVLVIGAGVLLIVRRRMRAEK